MSAVSTVFLSFFGVSLFVLILIAVAKAPELMRNIRLFLRQMAARKTREEKMLVDLEKLKADARKLEGIYRFEPAEPHHSHPQEKVANGAVSETLRASSR